MTVALWLGSVFAGVVFGYAVGVWATLQSVRSRLEEAHAEHGARVLERRRQFGAGFWSEP